jgi:hypothetical protein
MMPIKTVLTFAAITLTLYAFIPYIRDILKGRLRPHVFSWLIWGITTFVIFFAQLAAGGGIGAWAIGVSGSITLFIAGLAFARRGDITITRSDWLFFLAALSSLPLWFFTADPLWAVAVLTLVDLLGFGPTVRKVWDQPHSESIPFFGLFLIRNLLVVGALESRSLSTVLFPAAVAAACACLILLMMVRRRQASLPQP